MIMMLIAAVLIFLSKWKLFLGRGIVGHNWDWLIPFLKEQNRLAIFRPFFIWQEHAFGFQDSPRVYNIFQHFVGAAFNGEVQTKFLLFAIPLLSFVNSFVLLSFLLRKFLNVSGKTGVFLGALVYSFSPSVFNDFVGGQTIYLIGYAFFPLYVCLFFNIFEKRKFSGYLLGLLLVFAILAGSHHWLFALGISFLIFVVFYPRHYQKYLAVTLLLLLSIAYILLLLFSQLGRVEEIMPEQVRNEQLLVASLVNHKQTIDKIFLGAGYGDRNLFLNFLGNYRLVFFFCAYLFLIFIIGHLFFKYKLIKNKKIFFWTILLYILGLFLVKAGRTPLGSFFVFLMTKFVFFRVFRTFFHFFVLLNFSFAILTAISLSLVKSRRKLVGGILALSFLLSILPVFVEGDNGLQRLKAQKRDSLDLYQINPEYLKILKSQWTEPEWYRVLYIPPTISPIYKETFYQRWGQGGDPEVIYSPRPTLNDFALNSQTREIVDLIEQNIVSHKPLDQRLLGFLSFQKLIWRKDVLPSFSLLKDKYNDWSIEKKLKPLSTIVTSEYVDYFDLNQDYLVPHFYLPQKIIYANGGIESLPEILSFPDYPMRLGVYLEKKEEGAGEKVFREQAGEIFIRGELWDGPGVDKVRCLKGCVDEEEVFYPYVRHRPGSFFYRWAWLKEEWNRWKAKKVEEKILEEDLFYANKRISEMAEWGRELERQTGESEEVARRYRQLMEETIDLAENDEEKERIWGYLNKHREKIEDLKLEKPNFWQETFTLLEGKLTKVYQKPGLDLEGLEYRLRVPKKGNYLLFIRDLSVLDDYLSADWRMEIDGRVFKVDRGEIEKSGDWIKLGEKEFEEGEHQLLIHLPEPSNLVGDDWQRQEQARQEGGLIIFSNWFYDARSLVLQQINNWEPDEIYRLEFEYLAQNGKLGMGLTEEIIDPKKTEGITGQREIFKREFTGRGGDEWKEVNFLVKSSSDSLLARIYFWPVTDETKNTNLQLRNVSVRKVPEPEVVLRSSGSQSSGLEFQPPTLDLVRINPAKYKLRIEGARQAYTIVFSESFHQGWRAYVNRTRIKDGEIKEGENKNIFLDKNLLETWGKKPIPEERHFLVNGYANSWYITPRDADGREDYEIIVEFCPSDFSTSDCS